MTVQDELQQYLGKTKSSITSVAKAIDRSGSALSLWLKGDYAGDCKGVEQDIMAFLGRQKERERVHVTGDFVQTKQAQEILSVLRYAHIHQEMGVVYGNSGMGKTTAITYYSSRESGVIVITVDPVSLSPSAVLHDLAEAVNESTRGTLRGILRRVAKKLQDTGRLIIVDEAQFLTHRAIESLRKVHDVAKVGLVFVGMPRLYHHMIGNGVELFEQIKNRVGIKKELPHFDEEDAQLILRAFDPNIGEALIYMAYEMSGACARRLVKLYRHAARLSTARNHPISKEDFLEAQKFLYEDTPKKPAAKIIHTAANPKVQEMAPVAARVRA